MKLPFLESIGWQLSNVYSLDEVQRIKLYERYWHHKNTLEEEETNYILSLSSRYNSWIFTELQMFNSQHSNNIRKILNALNPQVFYDSCAYLAGGTLLSFEYGGYRLSRDIDFLVPYGTDNYKYLRNLIFDNGVEALFTDTSELSISQETINQYGIRFTVNVYGENIKVEIVSTSGYLFDIPVPTYFCSLPCLSVSNRFTSKLLANADRWNDKSTFSRDLIDLAVLRVYNPLPSTAIIQAERNYDVKRPLVRAIHKFFNDLTYQEYCFDNLEIEEENRLVVLDGIELLKELFLQ